MSKCEVGNERDVTLLLDRIASLVSFVIETTSNLNANPNFFLKITLSKVK
jgi:hypothetical protein